MGEKKDAEEKKLTPKKIKILVCVIYGDLFLGSCYGLMAPFFPAEAESKGASATEYGFILGVYQLVIFLTAIIYGYMIPRLGTGFFMKCGITISSVCTILFGALYYAPSGPIFISLSFLVRIIDAFGASAYFTASYALLAAEFPFMLGRAMSIVETAFCVGLTIGPALGGFLYGIGNYTTPFFTIGILLFTGALVNFYFLPNTDDAMMSSGKQPSVVKLIFQIDFMLDVISIILCLVMVGFNEATLEPHLRQFNLTSNTIGSIFLVAGLMDAVSSYMWGYVSEKVPNAQILIALGGVFYIITYLIIGPVPFLNFPTLLWVIILAQAFLGLGMAAEIVSSFTHAMKNSVERGFPDNVSTYALVSSVLLSASCLGGFIGPSLGGLCLDHVGYESSTIIMVVIKLALVTALLTRIFCKGKSKKIISTNSQTSVENGK